jgi:CARDB
MRPRRRPRVSAIAAAAVALLACALPSLAQAAPKRPDLTVSAVSPLTPSVVQKGQVSASITVRNAGKATAPGSTVGLYLSSDKRKSKSDKRLASTTFKSLKKGQRRVATGKGRLPKSVKRGAYALIACADDKSRAKESNERNNCRPIKGKVGVTGAAKPVGVAPHLDLANSFGQPIPADGGGTAFASGADGTSYTLIIPDRALTHDVRVTLTPITSIDGLPLSGGLVAGVQVDTDQLQLARPAQLVIQRSGLAPSPSQVAFGYHGLGNDFFLTPFGTPPAGYPSDAITIPVLHGGGYGIANATAADVAAQRAKPPARPEDALAQAATVLGGAAKRSSRVRAAAFDGASFTAEARRLYTERIQPQMTAAETNDAILPQAMGDAFGWMRQVVLLGDDAQFEKEFDQITASMEKGVNNAYEKAKERCQAGDYNQVARLIQIERFRQLIGFGDPGNTNIGEDIDKCLSFELRVKSHVEVHERANGHVDGVSELTSTVPLRFDFNTGRLSGQAPFEYKQFSWDTQVTITGGCTRTESANGTLLNSVLDVPSATVSTNDPGAPPSPPEINMIIDPGQPQEGAHYTDSGCGTGDSGDELLTEWYFEWTTFFHNGDIIASSPSGPWFFDKFTPGVRPSVGTKTFHLVAGARSLDETWEVVHTPKF